MSETGRGLPLLSGPAPSPAAADADKSCRRCNKEFAFLIVRHRKCNHCGHSFCHNCTDYQALMPRDNGYDAMSVCGFCIEYLTITAAGRGQLKTMQMSKLRNYINAYNIEIVDRIVEKDDLIDAIIKARGHNGCLPPDKEAYYRRHSIPNKSYPSRSRGFFSTSRQGQNTNFQTPPANPPPPPRPSPPEFARPDLEPDSPPPPPPPRHSYPNAPTPEEPSPQRQQQRTQYAPPPFPPPTQPQRPSASWEQQFRPPPPPPPRPPSSFGYSAPPPQPQFHTPPSDPPPPPPRPPSSFGYSVPPPQPQFHTPPSNPAGWWHSNFTSGPPPPPLFTRPTPQSTPQSAPPPPPLSTRPRAPSTAPAPTLDQLLSMPPDSIRTLSISILKSILFTNHVNVANILEKGDLVSKVISLVEDEKRERERMRLVGEMEELERVQRELEREGVDVAANASSMASDAASSSQQGERAVNSEGDRKEHHSDPMTGSAPASNISMSALERNGLCVVCQDEEANIAIVDCGHLAMCRSCSDLVMSSSKECPLCRTRIVTEARLLRIFKT